MKNGGPPSDLPDRSGSFVCSSFSLPPIFKNCKYFRTARLSSDNVLPYRHWPLVLGAYTISQNLSVIFVFLAVFRRLLDHTLDPRLLVALSSAGFVIGCLVWE